jgi:hypothetical protein
MASFNEAFEERLREIETYLDLLEALERQVQLGPPEIGGTRITTEQQRILYSAVYLQLYNLVEATVHWCIDAVSDAAAAGGRWRPGDLSAQLRREWVRTTAKTHIELNAENRLHATVQLCDGLVQARPVDKWDVERRGNWDDDAIQAITDRIGLDLQISRSVYSAVKRPFRDEKGPLALVRDLRNRLAHGTLSFAECGDGVTVTDLRDLKQRTANYLREVVAAFGTYLNEYQFLQPNRRPPEVAQ